MQQKSDGSWESDQSWNYPVSEGSGESETKHSVNINGASLHHKLRMIQQCHYSWSYNYDTSVYNWTYECPIDKWQMKCDPTSQTVREKAVREKGARKA